MVRRRSVIPLVLLAITLALVLGAAIIGLRSSRPSQGQIALQNAAQKTSAAPNFAFILSNGTGVPKSDLPPPNMRGFGSWQSPNKWQATLLYTDGPLSSETAIGSTLYLPALRGPTVALKLSSAALDTFGDPNGPVFLLPPLGLLNDAIQVSRHGDTYSFLVPELDLVGGWVAYAPISRAALALGDNVAFNTPARAQVVGGYVVALTLPEGIHATNHAHMGPVAWKLSHFGSAPSVTAPISSGPERRPRRPAEGSALAGPVMVSRTWWPSVASCCASTTTTRSGPICSPRRRPVVRSHPGGSA